MTARRAVVRDPFRIGELLVAPGRTATGELPISRLVTGTQISLPIQVLHGRRPGRTVWISAAVHGDEIAGVEIIRRVTRSLNARTMSGTLIAVPIVNVHGFLNGDRYLPDRRDLNRSFPGSANGSLAARIAHLFMTEIVKRCDVGIDLHTGSDHRTNLPHVRADLDDPGDAQTGRGLRRSRSCSTPRFATARSGPRRPRTVPRCCCTKAGRRGGSTPAAIDVGVQGIRNVLAELAMVDPDETGPRPAPIESRRSTWVRARRSGLALLADRARGDGRAGPTPGRDPRFGRQAAEPDHGSAHRCGDRPHPTPVGESGRRRRAHRRHPRRIRCRTCSHGAASTDDGGRRGMSRVMTATNMTGTG